MAAGTQVVKVDGQLPVEPEIEIVEEGTGVQPGQQLTTTETPVGQYDYDEEEERVGNAEAGRAEGGAVTTTETPEQLSARQRKRRTQMAARERDRTELARLRQENHELKQIAVRVDQRVSNVEISAADTQIASLESEIQRADSVIARAISAQNGDDATTAMQIRDTLRDRLNGLKAEKARAVDAAKRTQPVATQTGAEGALPPGITQAQVNNFRIFVQRHPWYDPQARDQESQQAKAIDAELQAEGSDPNSADHWLELEKRVREALPRYKEAANGGDNAGKGNGAAPVKVSRGPKLPGGNGGGGSGAGPVRFHLSAERKQALIDLGVYGTPDQNKYIKAYMQFDAAQPRKQ